MELRYLNNSDKEAWEKLAQTSASGGFMQSWAWSRLKEGSGQKVLRLGLVHEGTLCGGAMVYTVESSLGASPLLMPHGPVLPWHQPDIARRGLLLLEQECAALAQKLNAPALRVEPVLPPDIAAKFFPSAKRAPIDLVPTPSLVVDIGRSDAEILAGMKQKGRYHIKQAMRRGVEIVYGASDDFVEEFYALLELTGVRHRFPVEAKEFFCRLMEYLGPAGMARVYLARYKGMATAAAIAIFYGANATYLYGASSPFLPKLMSNYLLHWRMMQDARQCGCRAYDFYGIAPEGKPFHPYARFTEFKKKFGGKVVANAGAHDIIFYGQLSELWLKQVDALYVA